jgi:hypothetical protein
MVLVTELNDIVKCASYVVLQERMRSGSMRTRLC